MKKKKKALCHYMAPIEATKGKKPANEGQSQNTVIWDATAFVESLYVDNKRLIEENAVLRERAKVHVDKKAAIEVEIKEEDDGHEEG